MYQNGTYPPKPSETTQHASRSVIRCISVLLRNSLSGQIDTIYTRIASNLFPRHHKGTAWESFGSLERSGLSQFISALVGTGPYKYYGRLVSIIACLCCCHSFSRWKTAISPYFGLETFRTYLYTKVTLSKLGFLKVLCIPRLHNTYIVAVGNKWR